MNGAIERRAASAELLEKVLVGGDLSRLTAAQRLSYYQHLCESMCLNPLSRPFEYLQLSGKLVLYARKDATDQLRRRDRVSIAIVSRDRVDDSYVVVARATTPDGRSDESLAAVPLVDPRSGKQLCGEAFANALMKCEAKAKRRVTLSICGLGMLDETEVSSVPEAKPVHIDDETGEILDASTAATAPRAVPPGPRGGEHTHVPPESDTLFAELGEALERATSAAELNEVGKRIGAEEAAGRLKPAQVEGLRMIFKGQRAAFAALAGEAERVASGAVHAQHRTVAVAPGQSVAEAMKGEP